MERDIHNHFTWKEANGDSYLVRIEQETNPTVFSTGAGTDLFTLIYRITDFDDNPISELASLEGTFLTQAESTVAGMSLFRSKIRGHDVEKQEIVKPDGLLFCAAQSKGDGGFHWTVKAFRRTWEEI
ncbi:hypothetical protein B7494_g8001 [Chlorociboria aeruginascens]|nr:hypothetical protein B7494_g8001 [Chlorociboria aeruginascens]